MTPAGHEKPPISQWTEPRASGVAGAAVDVYLAQDSNGVWKFTDDKDEADGYFQEDANGINKIDPAAITGKRLRRVPGKSTRIEA